MRYFYAVHKQFGCIKRIPDTATGHMGHDWVVYENFPDEARYFDVLGREIYEDPPSEQQVFPDSMNT